MDKKAYLYIVEAGQFSFEVEIKELLGKVGDTICISTDGIDPDGFDVKITCIEPTQFDKLANIGYLSFDPEKEQSEQIKSIADIIVKKLDEKRRNEPS